MKHKLPKKVITAIKGCSEAQLDAMFGMLKYREVGILRKISAFAVILHLSEEEKSELIDSLPKASDGRILDKPSRNAICDLLIERASNGEEG